MMVCAEVDDPFVPLPDDLLVNLRESREVGRAGCVCVLAGCLGGRTGRR